MKDDITRLKAAAIKLDKQTSELKRSRRISTDMKKMRGLVDEATKVVTRNSADLG